MAELSTLGAVIKEAYEGQPDTNAFTDAAKAKLNSLLNSSFGGTYAELTGKPDLSFIPLVQKAAASGVASLGADGLVPLAQINVAGLNMIPTTQKGTANGVSTLNASSKIPIAQIDIDGLALIPLSQKATPNGVATLDSAGLVPLNQLNVSGLAFKGAWNASTNTPTLVNGTGGVGDFYKVGVAGDYNFGTQTFSFAEGDWVMFAAGVWQRLGVHESVASVNGKLGAVVLTAADVGALPSTYTPPAAAISSVNGKTGDVSLTAADVGALASTYTPPIQSVNGKTGVAVLSAADVGALPSSYAAPVTSVNSKTGAVALTAADVAARSNVWVPAWADVTGKPDFAALYQPLRRGNIGPAIPAGLYTLSASQNLTNNTTTIILWDTAEYDQFGVMTLSTGTITVPSWAKYMRVTGSVQFWGNATGARTFGLYASNGGLIAGAGLQRLQSPGVNALALPYTTGVIPVTAGAKYTTRAAQVSGGDLVVQGGSNRNLSWLQVELYE